MDSMHLFENRFDKWCFNLRIIKSDDISDLKQSIAMLLDLTLPQQGTRKISTISGLTTNLMHICFSLNKFRLILYFSSQYLFHKQEKCKSDQLNSK